ncbi:hypothetical protein D3C80_751620 [compost metagenome]
MNGLLFTLGRDVEEARQTIKTCQCQIAGNRQNLYQTFALTIFRYEGKAAPDATGRIALLHLPAIDIDMAGGVSMLAHHTLEKLGTSRAHKAVNAQNFACAHSQGDVINCKPARRTRQGDVFSAKPFCTDLVGHRLGEVLGIGADHRTHNPLRIDIFDLFLAGDFSVAQNRDVIANPHQFFKTMRNIDDCNALAFQLGNHLEQNIDFGCRKG